MVHRRQLTGVLALSCGFVLLAAFWLWFREPRYQGYPAGYWLEAYAGQATNYGFSIERTGRHIYSPGLTAESADPAAKPLKAMGQPAVDYLKGRVRSDPFGTHSLYGRIYKHCPIKPPSIFPEPSGRDMQRIQALYALVSIAPAQEVAPVVVDYLASESSYDFGLAVQALKALDAPLEIERLLTALARQSRYRDLKSAVDSRLVRSPAVAQIVSDLIFVPSEDDLWPFQTLRLIGARGTNALPNLLRCLASTNAETRYQGILTLEAIGPGAREALPALRNCLNEENPMIQSAARRAVHALDPGLALQVSP